MYISNILLSSGLLATTLAKLTTSQTPSLGVLSMITPTVQPSNVATSDALSLSSDAIEFYGSYTKADRFQFISALTSWELTAMRDVAAASSLLPQVTSLIKLVVGQETDLLDTPSEYLASVSSSITFLPSDIRSNVLSQMTGILSGYMSLASEDILHQTAAKGPITPGASINPGQPAASGSSPTQGGSAAASTSRAKAAPAATMDAHILAAAAIGAAGVIGVVLL